MKLFEASLFVPLRDGQGRATEIYRKGMVDRLALRCVHLTEYHGDRLSTDSNGRTVREPGFVYSIGLPKTDLAWFQHTAADIAKALDLDKIELRYPDGEIAWMTREQWEALTF